MSAKSFWAITLILVAESCVDRIDIDFDAQTFHLVVDGFISDQPGPYTIKLSQSFDIQSKTSFRLPVSAERVILSDDQGAVEMLTQPSRGTYVTNPKGIQGRVGGVYKIRIEFSNGLVYESKPDTICATGKVEKIYFRFRSDPSEQYVAGQGATKHSFDVFFDALAGTRNNYRFLWKFTGTYKVNIACCSCWVPLSNDEPIVSDDQLIQAGHFIGIKAYNVPITGYTFLYKVYAQVDQKSLSHQAYNFWRAIRAQKDATGSLFQPVSGKIPTNLVQVSGPASIVDGIFYATSISGNAIYVTPADAPNPNWIPKLEFASGSAILNPGYSCPALFPNSTPVRPAYWED